MTADRIASTGGIANSVLHYAFHDLRHTWASWHRQAGTSCDELKDLGGWKSRVMVERYAKFNRALDRGGGSNRARP
jgi:integrase